MTRLLQVSLLLAAAAAAAVAAPAAASEQPNGVHLHFGASGSGEVIAMWSLPKTPLAEAPKSGCSIWAEGGSKKSFSAEAYTYTAGGFAGTLYMAKFTGLTTASKMYIYQCGSDGAMSAEFNFRSAPEVGGSMSAIVWADMGINNPVSDSKPVQDLAAADAQSGNFPLIINAGDTSYADDYIVLGNNSWVLDKFWAEVEGAAAYSPMMLCPGNHEDQFHFAAHLNRTLMPVQGSGPLKRFYHSFDYGAVHFLSFSTEHSVEKNTEQWEFVVADLKAAQANRDKVPWIVVYTHHPFLCSDIIKEGRCDIQAPKYREQLEDVFYQYGVDLFVSGHNHNYERSYPYYNGTYTTSYHAPNRTVYVVNGAAGDIEGVENIWENQNKVPWRAAHNEKFHVGYSRMSANSTALQWTYIDAQENEVMDTWTLTK